MKNIDAIERWVAHFNNSNLDALVELYDEDAQIQVAFAPSVCSKAAIRALFEQYFAASSLQRIVRGLFTAAGGRVVLQWEDQEGVLGCNIYTFDNGRIRAQLEYFDQQSFRQLNGIEVPRATAAL